MPLYLYRLASTDIDSSIWYKIYKKVLVLLKLVSCQNINIWYE